MDLQRYQYLFFITPNKHSITKYVVKNEDIFGIS